jgi:hypothetical protein
VKRSVKEKEEEKGKECEMSEKECRGKIGKKG